VRQQLEQDAATMNCRRDKPDDGTSCQRADDSSPTLFPVALPRGLAIRIGVRLLRILRTGSRCSTETSQSSFYSSRLARDSPFDPRVNPNPS
jgi:hypothetical protein